MTDTPPETLGTYIRAKRDAAGLTQQQVAAKIGVTRQAVARWEADEANPTPRALHELTVAVPGVDAAELLALIPSGES